MLSPKRTKYRKAHKAEVEPTKAEVKTVATFFDKKHRERLKEQGPKLRQRLKAVEEQLARKDLTKTRRKKLELERIGLRAKLRPPGRSFANFLLKNWKFQKHLYDKYGGGRILWQQAGAEAFDEILVRVHWVKRRERDIPDLVLGPVDLLVEPFGHRGGDAEVLSRNEFA